MATIEKKTWPEFYAKTRSGAKKVEIRLANFKIKKGDVLLLKEWDPKRKVYTGKSLKRKISAIHKVPVGKYYSLGDIKKYGLYVMELK